jgi:uncharacterized Zn-binding protein involved in type VI secretion
MPTISVEGDTNVHGGAPFDTGLSPNVYIGNKKAVTVDTGSTQNDDLYNQNPRSHPQGVSGNQTATGGSATVYINGKKVHRIGDARIDGTTSGPGNSTVQVG